MTKYVFLILFLAVGIAEGQVNFSTGTNRLVKTIKSIPICVICDSTITKQGEWVKDWAINIYFHIECWRKFQNWLIVLYKEGISFSINEDDIKSLIIHLRDKEK